MEERDEHGRLPWWEDPDLDFDRARRWDIDTEELEDKKVDKPKIDYYKEARKRIMNDPWLKAAEEMQHIKLSPDQEAACNID